MNLLAKVFLLIAISLQLLMIQGCTTVPSGTSSSAAEVERLEKEIADLKRQIAILNRRLSETAPSTKVQRQPRMRPSVTFGGNPRLGNKKAAVAIIEFSDYQCPFCRRFHSQTFDLIKQNYVDTGNLLYVYRDYFLPNHRQALMASVAANCAGEQGAYWAMQRTLYNPGARLEKDYYLEYASGLKLKRDKFERCLADKKQVDEVVRDTRYGSSLGIRGTPAFFIGRVEGEKIVDVSLVIGAQPYPVFARAIDQALQRAQ